MHLSKMSTVYRTQSEKEVAEMKKQSVFYNLRYFVPPAAFLTVCLIACGTLMGWAVILKQQERTILASMTSAATIATGFITIVFTCILIVESVKQYGDKQKSRHVE